jgi:hypothetical protein
MGNNLYEMLAGVGNQAEYLVDDPFFMNSRQVSGWNIQPKTNAEAIWAPLVQGLLQGSLQGVGKQRAADAQYADMRASPMASLLAGDYASEERPAGMSPRGMTRDIVMASLAKQNADETAQREASAQIELQKLLMGKGAMFDPVKGLVPVPNLAKIEADAAAEAVGARKSAETKAEADTLGYNPKRMEETDKLRKEFSALPEVKAYSIVEKSAKIIDKAIKDPSAVSDQELVRYSILLIEPGMAVREGEAAAVASSQSIPEAWKGEINKSLNSGSALGADVREGIKRLAMRSFEGHKEPYDKALTFYKGQAKQRQLNPEDISYIGESADPAAVFASAPTKVINGITYKKVDGGWEAQ